VTVPVSKDKFAILATQQRLVMTDRSVSSVISKLLDYCLFNKFAGEMMMMMMKFAGSLQFSDLQFGFRKSPSCSHAVKSVVG